MEDYKEIFKLKQMLVREGISFEFNDSIFLSDGYQIVIYKNGERICDAVQHAWSYGSEEDLIEISGGLTEEELKSDTVLGYLTAEEVFKRFKYCYENNTYIYKEEEKMKETTITVNLENLTNNERDKLFSLVQKSNEKYEAYKPKINEQYWFIDALGNVSADIFLNYPTDHSQFILGNCFKTKKEAELYKEELLVIAELKHLAHKLNNGWKPDWNNYNEHKWYVYYSTREKRVKCDSVFGVVCLNNVLYFKSKELCKKAIDSIGEERLIKYYFKIQ